MDGAAVNDRISSRQSGVLLLVFADNNLDAVIIAAVLAHAMSQFHLMTLRAFNDSRQ